MRRSVDLLVIQPTPFCNINCTYCYLPDRSNTKKITSLVIDRIIDSLLADDLLGDHLSIVWHAGEPLVLPPSFYEPLFELFYNRLTPKGIKINYSIQTNGTIISQQWCDFIIKHDIKLGVSIDGPREVNDANRKTRHGKGTFDKIIEFITLLKKNDIPYHAIAVVNEKSLDDPEEFFNFFYNNGFYELGLNIEEVEGIHQHSSLFRDSLYEKTVTFFSKIFDLYQQSDGHMRVREFDRSLDSILRNPGTIDIQKLPTESHQNTPFGILSVDYLGNFSTFSPELLGQQNPKYDNFIFGNIFEKSFLELEQNPVYRDVAAEIEKGIHKCREECEFFPICGGGAPANKFFENGSFNSSETHYCNYNIKIPAELVISHLEEKLRIK